MAHTLTLSLPTICEKHPAILHQLAARFPLMGNSLQNKKTNRCGHSNKDSEVSPLAAVPNLKSFKFFWKTESKKGTIHLFFFFWLSVSSPSSHSLNAAGVTLKAYVS